MSKIRNHSIGNACLYATSGSFGNVGYMGVPLMVALLGERAIIPATLILTFDNIIHLVIVPLIAGRREQTSPIARILFSLSELAKSPFLIATILGILVSWFSLNVPNLLTSLTQQLGAAAIPTALFSLGLSLSLTKFSNISLDKLFLITMKLIIHPLIVALGLVLTGWFSPVWVATAIIMASLPTALTVYMLAAQYDKDAETVSSITLFGTIISVGTISMVIYWVDLYILKSGF